ncbi:uncharacterized protein N7477_009943 [Penicillium maclennaniae]|uniref:uncharacterized protein n=1 Tax=Penicillium maclennaniae TaxID=1343394 RepID=UPI002540CA69|nr:uncharacterized protein N7477_009943 [Penicillium maclennaniae]KAJ5662327.1 hypothetical protein N7477_009943 [Penicillium maclennaniae]
MATPSAKPGATPTHLSSPHPSSAALSRSMAHKSPSTRTPTGAGPGHSHQLSASHHYSTPLAVSSAVDDPVNFSSPSALLALSGYAGISPSPAVHDGLVGSGMSENDIQTLGMQGIKLGVARDSDEEMRHRIEEVVQSLRAAVAGRGISREGIERLGKIEGFESIWTFDNLNIAGNFVDLEIDFYPNEADIVKDVRLRYATPEHEEGELREEATTVLKRNLVQSPQDGETGRWKSLQGFYENLQWLAKLDKLSQEVNCFEALEGLQENLKRIWVEEAKHGKYSGDYEHLCTGTIGRPSMHKGSRIGLGLEYWVEQAKILDTKKRKNLDALAIDQTQDQADEEMHDQERTWAILLECEEGYPSLRISKEWVGSEVLTTGEKTAEEVSPHTTGSVNWLDPPQTMRLSHGDHPDPMVLDSSMLESTLPNRRFVARLEPALDMPIPAASEIYRHLGMQLPQDFKMVTYDGLLVSNGTPQSTDTSPHFSRKKRRMSVQAFDSTGEPCTKQHSYTFQAFESVAGRTIRELPISHPRQLADILPMFRQYALLASLIRKVFHPSAKDQTRLSETKTTSKPQVTAVQEPVFVTGKEGTIIWTNDDPNEEMLNNLFGDGSSNQSEATSTAWSFRNSSRSPSHIFNDDVKVDVTLRTQLGQAPALILLITDPGQSAGGCVLEPVQLAICIEVGLNGRISVVDSSGLGADNHQDGGDAEMQGTESPEESLQEIHKKIARVLEISQDLGILVEWVLRWLRQRAGSG